MIPTRQRSSRTFNNGWEHHNKSLNTTQNGLNGMRSISFNFRAESHMSDSQIWMISIQNRCLYVQYFKL
jgi:hypothetical protein